MATFEGTDFRAGTNLKSLLVLLVLWQVSRANFRDEVAEMQRRYDPE